MMLQLNPMIPVDTPKGEGFALLVIDYSQEHHTLWTVMLDAGYFWQFETSQLRVIANASLGRGSPKSIALTMAEIRKKFVG